MAQTPGQVTAEDGPVPGIPQGAQLFELSSRRVTELLDGLGACGDPAVREGAEELVRTLRDFYGAGLARIVHLVGREGSQGTIRDFLEDELTGGLLVLHDLHPEDAPSRVARALRAAGRGEAEPAGFDPATGVLRLLPPAPESGGEGGGDGHAARGTVPATARTRIEAALACLVPEVTDVDYGDAEGTAAEGAADGEDTEGRREDTVTTPV